MSDIRINKISGIQPQKTDSKELQEDKVEKQVTKKPEVVRKDAGEILDHMARSAQLNKFQVTKKEINVQKYVNADSEKRIEQMMKAFDETILKSAQVAIEEFGLPEEVGQDVAIMAFNQKFLV